MIRRAGNERCVLFDRHGDGLLQLVLAFHHFRRFVDDRHEFSYLSSFPLATRHGQNTWQTEPFTVCGAGATPRFFWAAKGFQMWGRSSPFRCFARVQINRRVMCNL